MSLREAAFHCTVKLTTKMRGVNTTAELHPVVENTVLRVKSIWGISHNFNTKDNSYSATKYIKEICKMAKQTEDLHRAKDRYSS